MAKCPWQRGATWLVQCVIGHGGATVRVTEGRKHRWQSRFLSSRCDIGTALRGQAKGAGGQFGRMAAGRKVVPPPTQPQQPVFNLPVPIRGETEGACSCRLCILCRREIGQQRSFTRLIRLSGLRSNARRGLRRGQGRLAVGFLALGLRVLSDRVVRRVILHHVTVKDSCACCSCR